ncbi:MAG: entry exclusion lipoprotein TrbK [Nanoarchaeota archaeon]|nr:entry exclusion lipoprotein TrbK [Nanoarchaeota archaeon]
MKGKIISGLAALVLGATSLAGCDEKKSENIDAKNCKAEFAKVQKKLKKIPTLISCWN